MRRPLLMALTIVATAGAAAAECVDITDEIAFCPENTLWEGLPWHQVPEPPTVLWETADMALMIGEIPVRFEGGSPMLGQTMLAEAIDAFAEITEGSEELGRFAPLGDGVAASSRVTKNPGQGVVEYVTLYAVGNEVLIIQTIAKDDTLTQDHGLRHEQALQALVEVNP